MKLIPITATAVEKLKSRAKLLTQTGNIKHTSALQQVAKEAGYTDWHHVVWCLVKNQPRPSEPCVSDLDAKQVPSNAESYMACLATNSAAVTVLPCSGDLFHVVEIEGIRFRAGIANDGPYVERVEGRFYSGGTVALGVSSICFTNEDSRYQGLSPDWWVCKYGAQQQRIHIGMLSMAGRLAFACEFGLPIHFPYSLSEEQLRLLPAMSFYSGRGATLFYISRAFEGLCAWVKKHPRKAKQFGANSYLGDWANKALNNSVDC